MSRVRDFWRKYEEKIIITIGFILVAFLSFGLGRLTGPQGASLPLTIEEDDNISNSEIYQADIKEAVENKGEPSVAKGFFVGSRNSNIYHWSGSSWAKKIKPENQIWFDSEEEAQKAGYKRSSDFEKLAPADYLLK